MVEAHGGDRVVKVVGGPVAEDVRLLQPDRITATSLDRLLCYFERFRIVVEAGKRHIVASFLHPLGNGQRDIAIP